MATTKALKFLNFFHPYVTNGNNSYGIANDPILQGFLSDINEFGIDQLLEADTLYPDDNGDFFARTYRPDNPDGIGQIPLPAINVDFSKEGAYSLYNWELFFHGVMFIANRLSKNGKYAEAMNWYHYVFDPTTNEMPGSDDSVSRYWKVLPFKTAPVEPIENFLNSLRPNSDPLNENTDIKAWRNKPFNPHLIARGRPVAYMKNIVFKYVENIISWGDDLFRQDTMESVNEATQMYVIASHILGPRPQFIPKRGKIKPRTYNSLKPLLDDFSNAIVQLENIFPYSSEVPELGEEYPGAILGMGPAFYFCIPENENMLKYWDTVGDRLFKIRHCMNIEGIERTLALFAPPIDPGMLINAAAQGLSIAGILSDLNSPAPLYRFNYLSQKATEFCGEVKALGNALLSAIEKKDVEELSRKRAQHETKLLDMISAIKERQVLEARANREGLDKNRETAKNRLKYYTDLLGIEDINISDVNQPPLELTSDTPLPPDINFTPLTPDVSIALVDGEERGVKLIAKEKEDLDKSKQSQQMQWDIVNMDIMANYMHLIPEIGGHASPLGVGVVLNFGGKALGCVSSMSSSKKVEASDLSYQASRALKMASFIRRDQEWTLQANMAAREIIQIDKQITATEIRIQIAQKELENHKQQIANAQEVEQFLRDKFTNQELYTWMKEQLYSVYKQAYQLAYDMAKKTEKAYRFEIGRNDTNFIQYGYWDGMYQGLVAGDKLHLAIKQMEKSFVEENRREFELVKHISLKNLNPYALLQLKQTGYCEISLPEELFDLDYAGHYFRRIKSVSISIPCIVGPYASVNCTLRLQRNSLRINTLNGTNRYRHNNEDGIPTDDEERFIENNIPFKAIATSSAQNDSGVFELNFRDERYLPFEGAGVISSWSLELSDPKLAQFDYNTISDVVMHLKYTARDGGDILKTAASDSLQSSINEMIVSASERGLMRLFSLKNDFPDEFHNMKSETSTERITKELKIGKMFFPFFTNNYKIKYKNTSTVVNKDGTNSTLFTIAISDSDLHPDIIDDNWKLFFKYSPADLQNQEDVYLLINYSLAFS